jgi:hypothetical protein
MQQWGTFEGEGRGGEGGRSEGWAGEQGLQAGRGSGSSLGFRIEGLGIRLADTLQGLYLSSCGFRV